MRILKVICVLFVSIISSFIYGKGHIVYICSDPEYASVTTIVNQLKDWHEDGKMYLYIQDKDRHFSCITKYDELEEQILYLLGNGITGAVPALSDIQYINNDLVDILKERIEFGDEILIVGEKDDDYVFDIVLSSNIAQDDNYMALFRKMIIANNFHQRIDVRCWGVEDRKIYNQSILK